jgi:methylmalonyl-CoA mutase C-terminal domain/subunit
MSGSKRIRVLLSKSDMDAHEIGIRYVARILRDNGFEAILTRYRVIDEVVKMALEEYVDVIGLSFYGSGLMYDVPRLMNLLKEKGLNDIPVIIGGTISEEERKKLFEIGVKEVFTPGRKTTSDIVEFIKSV